MPIVSDQSFQPNWINRNGHRSTYYAYFFRRVPPQAFRRVRIETPDQDFLDLDLLEQGSSTVVIVSHGLEGSSDSKYIKGMSHQLYKEALDVCAWNFRGCSGELNKNLRMYHSGATDDLHTVASYLETKYDTVLLVGFSLGGNLTVKYLGEEHHTKSDKIKAAVAISVPLDLSSCSYQMMKKQNYIYSKRFLLTLIKKVKQKHELYPDDLDLKYIPMIKTVFDFDDFYTAPIHGFDGAEDYYQQCSSRHFISGIEIPTMIINALDDPFLADACYPTKEGESSKFVHLLYPKYGGHVGFGGEGEKRYWSEKQTISFFKKYSPS